jgi:DNA-binding GntR family transcriptional regulator
MRKPGESAYTFLRQRLIAGYYVPRSQLKEEHVAEELGISRTPVRAALKRLVEDGLVVSEANRGIFVAEWTDQDIRDVWSLRLVLEPLAASLAAERAGEDQIASIREANERLRQALQSKRQTRISEMQKANYDFHAEVIRASGSPRLRTVAMQTAGTPMLIGTYYVVDDDNIQRSINHHEDIVSAIAMREPEAASKAMWLHLKLSVASFFERKKSSAREAGVHSFRP